jgi:hypothetical protein
METSWANLVWTQETWHLNFKVLVYIYMSIKSMLAISFTSDAYTIQLEVNYMFA